MDDDNYLISIRKQLENRFSSRKSSENIYAIPDIWSPRNRNSIRSGIQNIDPHLFFLKALDSVAGRNTVPIKKVQSAIWTKEAVVYNMFIRASCAFDHDQNGILDLPSNKDGWRETGTFLKAVAMLPYISSLGVNTIHLLPVTAVGADGKKGSLGSPYAIRNPYRLDENLHEPNAGLGVEEEFRLFVNSAHRMGIRIVVEFVFRTSSKDSDWIKDHPDWFYWIRESVRDREPKSNNESDYGNPVFTDEELRRIYADVRSGSLDNLISPHKIYLDMFTDPPAAVNVKREHDRYIGYSGEGSRVRIPGAFADWPPDDRQPPWGDVTYLRMYDHSEFNYIAYNTVRMYDSRLADPENINRKLWDYIVGIVPYYQRKFGIDGVMIDMGHALPMDLKKEIIQTVRENDPGFAFWDENFEVTEQSVREGYDSVIGYQWIDQHIVGKFKKLLMRFSDDGFPLPFFATSESHNTPRTASRDGGVLYSKYSWALSNFIAAIPFIHSGFEIGETTPINTGLGFIKEEALKYPSHKLPLFNEYAFTWINENQIVDWVQKVSSVRAGYRDLIIETGKESFVWIETGQPDIIAFIRKSEKYSRELLIVANSDMHRKHKIELQADIKRKIIIDLLSDKTFTTVNNKISGDLEPGQVSVFEIK